MTVIRPNSISGVTSITGQGGDISIFRADGTAGDLVVNNINAGVSTLTGALTGTTASFSGDVGIGGTLTYEDVSNIDSVGIITARLGIDCNGNATFGANGSITSSANFVLSSNKLRVTGSDTVGIECQRSSNATIQCTETTNNTDLQLRANATGGLVRTATNKPLILGTNQQERLRIGESGQIGLGGANYGTSGQVLTSQGSGSAVQWATPSAGGHTENYARVTFGNTYDTNSGYIVHNITSVVSNGITGDTTNEKVTPTVAGTYLVIYNAHWLGLHASGTTYYNRITKNGSEIFSSNFSSYNTGSHMHTVMQTISMNGSSDYFQFEFYENKAGAAAYVSHKSRAVVILLDT